MTTAADALRNVLVPVLPNYVPQFGRWEDLGRDKRYAVIRPAGGGAAELVRRPAFSLMLIGPDGEGNGPTSADADTVVQTLRTTAGALVFLQPAEPVFLASDDGRAIFEIAISAITT